MREPEVEPGGFYKKRVINGILKIRYQDEKCFYGLGAGVLFLLRYVKHKYLPAW
jgi:hypothetical protein